MQTIGTVLFDSVDFKSAGVPMRMIALKYFSCDSILLPLCSENTFSKIISLNGHQDLRSMVISRQSIFHAGASIFRQN